MVERAERPGQEELISGGDILSSEDFDAVIFDLDGVITDTARAHFAAWKETFDNFLRTLEGRDFTPFTTEDYRRYVDGKSRIEGIESFLESRSIPLPLGEESPQRGTKESETIHSLARKKNRRYQNYLEAGEIEVFEESVDLVRQLLRKGMKTALVSSSKNAKRVLEILDLESFFDVRVDGNTLQEMDLKGKPAPDLFAEAAGRLGVDPRRAVVIEDAESGVQAGRAGGFGLVIGVSKNHGEQRSLLDAGADLAVENLGQLLTRH